MNWLRLNLSLTDYDLVASEYYNSVCNTRCHKISHCELFVLWWITRWEFGQSFGLEAPGGPTKLARICIIWWHHPTLPTLRVVLRTHLSLTKVSTRGTFSSKDVCSCLSGIVWQLVSYRIATGNFHLAAFYVLVL